MMSVMCCCCCDNSDDVAPTQDNRSLRSTGQRMQREYSTKLPFTDINLNTSNPLKLIDGYLDEPVLPLEDALKPFDGKIDQLSDYIKEAKTKCNYPSEHNLTRDESAAIFIYTMKWSDGCLYDHLQAAWRSKDRSELKPWFKYLKLFKGALDKLPNTDTEIWQGTSYDEKWKEQLLSNSLPLYSSMGSCSPSEKELKEYLEQNGESKKILIAYQSVNGKSVTGYTANSWKEVMIWPGMKLGVTKYVVDAAANLLIVHLKSKPKGPPKSTVSMVSSSEEHFVCPYKGCGNRCPGDHKGNHCHSFAILFHNCHHHCGPCNKCEKCGKLVPNLCKCYKCGGFYCEKCCFK